MIPSALFGAAALLLSGCGTCMFATCPDYEDAQPGTYDGAFRDGALDGAAASVEVTGDEVIITVTDADGNTWAYSYLAEGPIME